MTRRHVRVGNDATSRRRRNPLEDISVTERISWVVFKGERVYDRAGLFTQQ